jgi:hypothetical protein
MSICIRVCACVRESRRRARRGRGLQAVAKIRHGTAVCDVISSVAAFPSKNCEPVSRSSSQGELTVCRFEKKKE